MRLEKGLPNLRTRRMYIALRRAFTQGCERFGFRLCHYTVSPNHLHLICEAKDRQALSQGMQGLAIRLAKGINRAAKRKGTVFRERYHVRSMESPRQVRGTLCYVLCNHRKHAAEHKVYVAPRFVDWFSSAALFSGWREVWVRDKARAGPTWADITDGKRPVAGARTWLLRDGWRRGGPKISVRETPGRQH